MFVWGNREVQNIFTRWPSISFENNAYDNFTKLQKFTIDLNGREKLRTEIVSFFDELKQSRDWMRHRRVGFKDCQRPMYSTSDNEGSRVTSYCPP